MWQRAYCVAAALFVTSGECSAVLDRLGAAPGTISVEQALTLACFSYFFFFFCLCFCLFLSPFSFTPHKPPFKRRFITKYQKKTSSHLTQPLRGTEGLNRLPGVTQKSGKVAELGFEPTSLKVHGFPPIPKASQSC